MSDYILLEYSNSHDFGDIAYHNSFINRVYLDADVSKPEYELLEEGIEDADGEFDPTFQKWAKKYSIVFYAQEFLVDALTLMTLHDQVYITLQNGESSQVLDVDVSYKWDADIECWAEVTISFVTTYVIRKNCDEDFDYQCHEALITCASVYDADDGGAGQTHWEKTDVGNLETAFFYTATGGSFYVGTDAIPAGFYGGVDGVWVRQELGTGGFGDVTDLSGAGDCIFLSEALPRYAKVPYIRQIDDETLGFAKVYAYADGIENTFFQVYRDDGGGYDAVGSPALASDFIHGYTVNSGAGVGILFKILWYTHSCTYGYSNIVTKTIT